MDELLMIHSMHKLCLKLCKVVNWWLYRYNNMYGRLFPRSPVSFPSSHCFIFRLFLMRLICYRIYFSIRHRIKSFYCIFKHFSKWKFTGFGIGHRTSGIITLRIISFWVNDITERRSILPKSRAVHWLNSCCYTA